MIFASRSTEYGDRRGSSPIIWKQNNWLKSKFTCSDQTLVSREGSQPVRQQNLEWIQTNYTSHKNCSSIAGFSHIQRCEEDAHSWSPAKRWINATLKRNSYKERVHRFSSLVIKTEDDALTRWTKKNGSKQHDEASEDTKSVDHTKKDGEDDDDDDTTTHTKNQKSMIFESSRSGDQWRERTLGSLPYAMLRND